jgi:uncharacterized protein (DUF433 family)
MPSDDFELYLFGHTDLPFFQPTGISFLQERYFDPYGHRRLDLWSSTLKEMAQRMAGSWASDLRETELRQYRVPLIEGFKSAVDKYVSISVDPNVMAGAPCIDGTRIPVYMVLDAIEAGGTLESALASYPRLTIQQVKDAIGFAKLVVESPIEHETAPAPR